MTDPTDTRETPEPDDTDESEELLSGEGWEQRWTTVDALGDHLPMAVGASDAFAFKPFGLGARVKLERDMAKIKGKHGLPALASYAAAACLATLQGEDLTQLSADAAALKVQMLPWASVLHLIFRMQIARQGGRDSIDLDDIRCPRCRHLHRHLTVHIGAMRVRAVGAVAALPEEELELFDGFDFPAGKHVASVVLRPARWSFMASLSDADLGHEGALTLAGLEAGICGVDTVSGEVSVPAAALGALTDTDTALLDEEHTLLSGGPTMLIPAQCERGCEFEVPYNWRSAAFFGASSRRDRRSRRKSRRRAK